MSNLLDNNTPHELMEITIRDIKHRQAKREKEAYQYEAKKYEIIQNKMRRRK